MRKRSQAIHFIKGALPNSELWEVRTARVVTTPMAANGLIYKTFTRQSPRGCAVLQIGLMDCGSRYTPHAVMPFNTTNMIAHAVRLSICKITG